MLKLVSLKAAQSSEEFAKLLGYSNATKLTGVLYDHSHSGVRYTSFEIPKKSGGMRTIDAPNSHLKILQSRLNSLLQDCISSIEKQSEIENKIVHGFKRNFSILTNAHAHINKKYVLNLDIEDFFGSINFGRVRGYFLSNKNFRLDEKISTMIAQIACHKDGLPQGSPCSPVISNLIFQSTDIKLLNYCKKNKIIYTRYADDLTFSSNEKIDKRKIERIIKIIESSKNHKTNFQVNNNKTRLQEKGLRQSVTGLVVNRKVSIRKEYFREARAAVENFIRKQHFEILDEENNLNKLDGVLSFIHHVDLYEKKRSSHNLNNSEKLELLRNLNSRDRVYRDFFIYNYFFHTRKPLVIGEGVTDSIYLKHAMNQIYKNDTRFFKKVDEEYVSKIDFFNWNNKVNHLLGMEGGGGTLNNFLTTLQSIINGSSRLKSLNMNNMRPIIFIVDTDSSGIKALRSLSSIKIDDKKLSETYPARIVSGVIPISLDLNKDIEDLFHTDIKTHKLGDLKFELYSKQNEKSYPKIVFARQVVKKLAKPKHMKNFKPIFERIASTFGLTKS